MTPFDIVFHFYFSGKQLSKVQMRSFSETLQIKRKELLISLKDGTLHVPNHLITMATDISKDPSSELHGFLRTQMTISVEDR